MASLEFARYEAAALPGEEEAGGGARAGGAALEEGRPMLGAAGEPPAAAGEWRRRRGRRGAAGGGGWGGAGLLAAAAKPVQVLLLAVAVALLGAQLEQTRSAGRGIETLVNASAPAPPADYAAALDALRASQHAVEVGSRAFPYPAWLAFRGGGGPLEATGGANLLLEVPRAMLGRLLVAAAEVSRASGEGFLLHQPLGDTHFELRRGPGPGAVDAVRPRLDARALPGSTMERALAEGGLAATPRAAFRAEAGFRNLTDAAAGPDGRGGPAREGIDIVDVTAWALQGFGALDEYVASGARLLNATAFERNLELELEASLCEKGREAECGPGTEGGEVVGIHVSVVALPPLEESAAPRVSDDRVGFFRECFSALGTLHDGAPQPSSPASPPAGEGGRPDSGFSRHDQDPHVCYIHRWRLELADPACLAACAPKKPIVYHVDPSVPERWAGCVARGVENWNRAFDEAGWSGAMVARREGDADWPADYAAADMRYSSITWAPSLEQTYAVGPSNVDPRTGEILNADIMFAESWVRHFLGDWQGVAPEGGAGPGGLDGEGAGGHRDGHGHGHGHGSQYGRVYRGSRPSAQCFHHHGDSNGGTGAASALRAAMAAGSEWPASGSVHSAEEYVCEALTEVVMHEVGHTLGLRHNFAGSTAIPLEKLGDKAFTQEYGTTSSVMDYLPPVTPANRSAQGHYYTPTVGYYDRVAIRYGYLPVPAAEERRLAAAGKKTPAAVAALEAAASDSAAVGGSRGGVSGADLRAMLHFCTDDDDSRPGGVDPACSVYDLSADVLGYFRDRLALVADVKGRLWERTVGAGGDWNWATGALSSMLYTSSTSVASAARYAAKHLGGHVVSRQARFGGAGGAPLALTERRKQLEALDLIAEVLTGDALYVAPENYTSLLLHGWAMVGPGVGGMPDESALGRLPFPVLEAARKAKRQILQNVLSPRRVAHMQHSAWALEGSVEGGLPPRQVVEALHRAVWGPEVAAFSGREFYGAMQVCGHLLKTTGTCGGQAGATPPFLAAARAAAASLGRQGVEQRALQGLWVEELQQVLEREAGAAQDELGASAREKLGELNDQITVLLLDDASRRALSPEAFSHVVALRGLLTEGPPERLLLAP